jgi:signal transduction histidine kinase
VTSTLSEIGEFHESVEARPGMLAMRLRHGILVAEASRYAPFFGRTEMELLREIGLFADLALERARLFDREREAREDAERANAELESFVYSASHDLRSPLITMLSYLDYLRADVGDRAGDDVVRYMDRMQASGRYMHQLIADLLELSRIGRMQTEGADVHLAVVVRDIADGVRASHPSVTVAVGDLPIVRLNTVRARQLFTNLIDNAIAHGGRPDVHISVRSSDTSGGLVEICVSDDGLGIPKEYRERVFGVFERLSPNTESEQGTGIGLAICKKIVEHAAGRIWIADAPVGMELHLTLPVVTTSRRLDTATIAGERTR